MPPIKWIPVSRDEHGNILAYINNDTGEVRQMLWGLPGWWHVGITNDGLVVRERTRRPRRER